MFVPGPEGPLEDPERVYHYDFELDERSLIQPPFNRWVNLPLLARLPDTIAPNVYTFLGHGCSLAAFAMLMAAPPAGLEGLAARAISALAALLLFVYCVTDSIDGLHARAIGVANPLGDFYDHGLDTLAGFMIPLGGMVAYGARPVTSLALVGAFALGWWANNLERRRAGPLTLPPFGAMEGNFVAIAIHLGAAAAGPELWQLRAGPLALIDWIGAGACLGFAAVALPALIAVGRDRARALPVLVDLAACALAWTGARRAGLDPSWVVLVLGLAATRHSWAILRHILIGARLRVGDAFPTAALIAMAACCVQHPPWAPWAIAGAGAVVLAKLAWQIGHITWYVLDRLELDLLTLTPAQRARVWARPPAGESP